MAQPNIDDYDLLNTLGTGTYSTVYKARHKQTKEYVAVKTMAKQNLSISSAENLLREIKLLKKLKHRYIVEMLDFRWDDKNIYIIMELCDQGDLSTYIRNHKTLSESTCKFFSRQLALALKYMRENNVSHFDLKPQNLLLTRSPVMTLKVADFGFAQHLRLGEENTTIKGSLLYMAPEVILKRCYDPSADLWSIGVILYECLFGFAPYRSQTMEELLLKITSQQRIDIPAKPKLSSPCLDLLTRLLVHNPKQRITFDQFFVHEFLDLEHEPTSENLVKSIAIITKAIELDQKDDYSEAYRLYCKGLEYFVPIIKAAPNSRTRRQLREQANTYLRRAEELRTILRSQRKYGSNEPPSTHHLSSSSSSGEKNNVKVNNMQPPKKQNSAKNSPRAGECSKSNAIEPSTLFEQLYPLCVSSPAIKNGLEIGRNAELYAYENNLQIAVEQFITALGILVPLLAKEPKGKRQDLLHLQIQNWMKEAECTKTLLSIHNLDNEVGTMSLDENTSNDEKISPPITNSSVPGVTDGVEANETMASETASGQQSHHRHCCIQ